MRDRVGSCAAYDPAAHAMESIAREHSRSSTGCATLNLNAEIDKPHLIAALQVSDSSPLAVIHALPHAARHSQSSCSSDVPLQGQIGLRLHTAHSLEIYTFSFEIYASRSFASSTEALRFAAPAARLTD